VITPELEAVTTPQYKVFREFFSDLDVGTNHTNSASSASSDVSTTGDGSLNFDDE